MASLELGHVFVQFWFLDSTFHVCTCKINFRALPDKSTVQFKSGASVLLARAAKVQTLVVAHVPRDRVPFEGISLEECR